jgi:hypothetical protein
MPDFIMNLKVTTLLGGILFLISLWVLRVIIQKEKENIIRGLSIFLVFLFGMIFLNQSGYRDITIGQIAERLFPQKYHVYEYYVEQGSSAQGRYVRYVFEPPRPRLKLVMAENGTYLHFSNPVSLNRVLRFLDLPPVQSGVPELSSLTHSRLDANLYQWPDYTMGKLTAVRGLCRNTEAADAFTCLLQITIITHPY